MHSNYAWSHKLPNKFLGYFFNHIRDEFNAYHASFDDLENSDQWIAQYAYGLDPELLGLSHVFKRTPYANPDSYREQLEAAVSRGWVQRVEDGGYGITDKGRGYVAGLFALSNQGYDQIETLPVETLETAIALLEKVDAHIGTLSDPPEKPAWKLAHIFGEGDTSVLYRLRRRAIFLLAYRDDAHIAAWSGHEVNGYVFETFSKVWEGDASNAAQLAEQLDYRNYDEAKYQSALDELVERGWLAESDGAYAVTDEGRRLREAIEAQTNAYYDLALGGLSADELAELEAIFTALTEKHQPEEAGA
jgi:DNA-binding MarR family transcriptional regulator